MNYLKLVSWGIDTTSPSAESNGLGRPFLAKKLRRSELIIGILHVDHFNDEICAMLPETTR